MKRAAAEPAQRRTASDAGGAGSDAAGARPSHGSEPSSAESGAPEADDVNNDGNGSENSDSVDESGETSSGESSASSAPPSPKVLPSRSTRGRRQTKLVGEAAEADAEFWGQDAFKEDTTDSEFEASSESAQPAKPLVPRSFRVAGQVRATARTPTLMLPSRTLMERQGPGAAALVLPLALARLASLVQRATAVLRGCLRGRMFTLIRRCGGSARDHRMEPLAAIAATQVL